MKYAIGLMLRAMGLAMGLCVVVLSRMGELSAQSGFTMLGVGLAALGFSSLEQFTRK